ncbi:MAG TPA: hypothetical protein VN934_12490 [Candidatus Tumulicola sp.]|nr:hypothetical protein [Candidatus Tumulicola sp.]
MRTIKYAAAACLAAALSFMGCAPSVNESPWQGHEPVIDAFFQQPSKIQMLTFKSYSLDDQYAIFLYGNQVLEPPAIQLATAFGAEGQQVVPYLSAHLERTSRDLTVRDLVFVFREMDRQRAYNVGKDTTLMNLLREAVSKMKDPVWKRIAERDLAVLR